MTKNGTFILILIFILVFLFHKNDFLVILLFYLSLFSKFIVEHIIRKQKKQRFKIKTVSFLTKLILKMHGGGSFRSSFHSILLEERGEFARRMQKIWNVVAFSQQNNDLLKSTDIKNLVEELRSIDQCNHNVIQQLIFLKNKRQLEVNFRRRSGQILVQTRFQSILMFVIYLAVMIFVVSEYGFLKNLKLFLTSGLLFLTGIFFVLALGRKIKWKV